MKYGWAVVVLGMTTAACGMFDSKQDKCLKDPASCLDASVTLPGAGAVGKQCETNDQCMGMLRLACVEGSCQFASDLVQGDPCNATLECSEGLYCNVEDGSHQCQPAGMAAAGDRCAATGDCQRGLVCTFDQGLAKHCVMAGTGDIGAKCDGPSDCLAGLFCPPPVAGADRVCIPPVGTPPAVRWDGLACPPDADDAVAYFEVPRGGGSDGDFFRLPFPNDVRKTASGLNLEGFPSAGDLFGIGVDFVGTYVKAAQEDLTAFGTNPVVYFRFSKRYTGIADSTVMLLDIGKSSPDYGRALSRSWGTSAGEVTSYVCPNWLNVRTGSGSPLRPGSTFAVILTKGIKPKDGGEFARGADLDALLSDSAPSDGVLAAAHAAYAPLRSFLADAANDKINPDDILNAAVFTTQDPNAVIAGLHQAVASAAAPTVKDVTVCQAGVQSPCDDQGERVCDAANGDFVEIHGRISLPIFQAGQAPYTSEGGAISLDEAGKAIVQRSEDVCFGLTLPRKPAPEGGYPLVIYAHGTGGSFKSGIRDLATTATGASAAVLTIDMPQHGSRKAGSKLGSDELFYNFLNPRAGRDNVAQGSADLMSLVRWATQVDDGAQSAFGQAVKFDRSKIMLFGHSQGATHASLIIPYENDVKAAVLSGIGGDLSEGLVSKRKPIDLASQLYLVIGDPEAAPAGELCPPMLDAKTGKPRVDGDGNVVKYSCIGAEHPVYGLVQMYMERSDPVNFGAGLRNPPKDGTAKHVFMTYGLGDTYAPEPTQLAYALAAELDHVAPALTPIRRDGDNAITVAAPLSENVTVGELKVTQGVRQYEPESGKDGHFVYLGPAQADWQRFVTAVLGGQTPSIGM